MKKTLQPNGLPLLVGSLPVDAHDRAAELVFRHTPEIPSWAQLPVYKHEGMIRQFLPGMPGHTRKQDKDFIDTAGSNF